MGNQIEMQHGMDGEDSVLKVEQTGKNNLGDGGGYPLSFAQERLWFFDRLLPNSNLYNMPLAFYLCGPLDSLALTDSFRELRSRHAICRTRFIEHNGSPVQVIDPPENGPVPVISLEYLPAVARSQEVNRLVAEEANLPFDLSKGPIMRVKLLRVGPDEHVLLVTFHHIIADGWSVGILLSELEFLYAAFRRGSNASLSELPIQYVDYAVWQRRSLEEDVLDQQLKHWATQLKGAPALLNLPFDHPRPARQIFRGAQRLRQSSSHLGEQVTTLAQRAGVTPFMALLGIFQVLLARYTGQFDIPVLCAMANRDRPETQELVGPMMNLVVLRTVLANNPKAMQVLEQVREALFDAYEHQDVPFEMLVQHLEPQRDPGRHPLAQVAFSMTHSEGASLDLRGLTVTRIYTERGVAKVDLTLFVEIRPNGFFSGLEYNSALFDVATIDRMLEHFERCVSAIAADPGLRILSIPLFEPEVATALGLPQDRVHKLSPLTPTQRDNYVAEQLAPDTGLMRVVGTLPLGQDISPELWRDAMMLAISTDDIVRTRFTTYNHQVYQFVYPELSLPHQFIDLTGGSRTLNDVIEEEAARSFNIATGPLYRSVLVKTTAGDYVAILAWHHLVCDGFSTHVAFARAWRAYTELQQDCALQQQTTSFYSFVGESLASFDAAETRAFWTNETSEITALQCYSNPSSQAKASAIVTSLENEELDRIREFCSKNGCTLATYLLGAFGLTVQKYCNPAGDFIISHLLHGRSAAQRETLGCFYHVLPVIFFRNAFAGGVSSSTYLGLVGESKKRARGNEKISLAQQKTAIAESSRPRFFYNFFSFLAVDKPGERQAGHIRFYQQFAPDEVHLLVRDLGTRVEMIVNFHESSFDDLRFVERIATCARQMASRPENIVAVDILLEEKSAGLVKVLHEPGTLTHDLIAAQARLTPDAVAVVADEVLTYQELNDRAERWARRLHALGIGPETLVALLAPRNADFLASLLAILKAGGAFLPLDPAQPVERLARILQSSGSRFLLAPAAFQDLAQKIKAPSICKQDFEIVFIEDLNENGRDIPPCQLTPRNLSYVIYTSGSTGDPKGAMITHDGMLNHLLCKVETLSISSCDVLAQTSSQAVDVCVWQFLTALLTGGRVCILQDDVARDPRRLLQAVDKLGITILEIVPSMMRAMLVELNEEAGRPHLSSLRWLVVNGEVLPPELCRQWFELYSGVPLINAYGPTECSDDIAQYYIMKPSDVARRRVPIGRVLPNLRVHVLGPDGNPVPVSAAGHLHIGGTGVGRGYYNDPARTAETYVPDPFSSVPGARLYRTGDLGRFDHDGFMDFLDRIDFQVKIRGYRIELGEIEAALFQHPKVGHTVVTTFNGSVSDLRLAAYVVPRDSHVVAVPEILAFLKARIPEYMLPSAVVILDSMPLLASGKINRKALPSPEHSGYIPEDTYIAPRTPTEEFIATMWKNLLGVPKVGTQDNFFQLGGHSLLATQVVSRLRHAYRVEVPLQHVFDAPTLGELALIVEQLRASQLAGDEISKLIAEIKDMPPELLQNELEQRRRPTAPGKDEFEAA
jgi:amino acid adenylation domain-containing protein